MHHGLAKPIARLRWSLREITERLGITFETIHDDLDELQAALIAGVSSRQFALVRHRHQPNPGTDILTGERSTDFTSDLAEVLHLLGFDSGALRWIHPDVTDIEKALAQQGMSEATFMSDRQGKARGVKRGYVAESLLGTYIDELQFLITLKQSVSILHNRIHDKLAYVAIEKLSRQHPSLDLQYAGAAVAGIDIRGFASDGSLQLIAEVKATHTTDKVRLREPQKKQMKRIYDGWLMSRGP